MLQMKSASLTQTQRVVDVARQTLEIEALALQALASRVGNAMRDVVGVILQSPGRVIVMGIGKSGHVGRKIAATLASTGTPAFFVHPAEASHGDLGMVTSQDVVLAISNSGESEELTAVLPFIKRLGATLVGMTGKPESSLAQHADWVLDAAVSQEACPHNLAPTASTTAQMALGDALAMALLDARGFQPEDFARSHPGGSLGRRLLTLVRDLMRTGDALPVVSPLADFGEVMQAMGAKGLGAAIVVDETQRPLGIFTDGDLRRLLAQGQDVRPLRARDIMQPHPRRVLASALAAEAADVMECHAITSVLVVDEAGCLVGALNTNDLMRAKVI